MQVLVFGTPSTVIRQSEQYPIAQNRPLASQRFGEYLEARIPWPVFN